MQQFVAGILKIIFFQKTFKNFNPSFINENRERFGRV